MKIPHLLKTALLLCVPLLWLSCSSWEDVAAPDEFRPVKITSVTPNTNVYVGDAIIISGENFIENKEYNQVWFGGNIRGIVDSATATRLFLKVPEGAQSGLISVSNGIYADTLMSTFAIVKESPFKNVSISYNGFKVIRNFSATVYKDGSPVTTYSRDTIAIETANYNIERTKVNKGVVMNDNCLKWWWEMPYPDTTFQNYQWSNSHLIYTALISDVDTASKIITKLHFLYSTSEPGDDKESIYCQKTTIEFKNVPYILQNGKIHARINGIKILELLKIYNYSGKSTTYSGRNSWSERTIDGIFQILPDAYFEMTLE
ncbi:MAG: IPT/TIG domain-containing protein [Bacteroidota bacterium]